MRHCRWYIPVTETPFTLLCGMRWIMRRARFLLLRLIQNWMRAYHVINSTITKMNMCIVGVSA